jgi:hypothetical protein
MSRLRSPYNLGSTPSNVKGMLVDTLYFIDRWITLRSTIDTTGRSGCERTAHVCFARAEILKDKYPGAGAITFSALRGARP